MSDGLDEWLALGRAEEPPSHAASNASASKKPSSRRIARPYLIVDTQECGHRVGPAHDIESIVVCCVARKTRSVRRITFGALAASAMVLSACGGSSKPKPSQTSSPSTSSPSSSVSSSTTPPKKPAPAAINPFTGGKPSPNPVVAVKVEDTQEARPQVGLNLADIVYIEQVEGGLTRLIAIFDTHLPSTVGPVRSTRNDDPEIMQQYGGVIYVASGGSKREYIPLDASNLRQVIDDRGGPGFSRNDNRFAPHNLFADLALIAKVKKGPKAKSIGLVWSTKIVNPTAPGTVVNTEVGGTPVVFRWNSSEHRYDRYVGGSPDRLANGHDISTPNVIVQFVKGNVYALDIDPAGNPAWYQHTVGSGKVVVFRNGKRIVGTWNRKYAFQPTHLVDAHGAPIALAPGGAWFVLVNTGTALAS